jgi:3-hydroxyisobutyrate dehydrogenase
MQSVALLGLGIMGSGMAHNLLKAGFPLTVYNRTRTKAEPFAAQGARIAETPCDAAEGADVIVSMVGDDDASRAMWLGSSNHDGALDGAKTGAVLVECSTLSVGWVRELVELANERGLQFLDSPVTGSKEAAQSGTLRLFVGGEAAALERVRPILEAFSQQINHMGPHGSGTIMKLINNMMAAVQVVAFAEGLALAERARLNIQDFVAHISAGAPGSPIVKGKAPRMVARRYDDTDFALRWMHKDTVYALRAVEELGSTAPAVQTASHVFQQARALGLDDLDMAAVFEAVRPTK